jgi:hypothetical protein
MTTIEVASQDSKVKAQPIFTGSARWIAAILLVAGPLLQAIEFLLEGEAGDFAAQVAAWTANPSRMGLAIAIGLLAVPFLLGGNLVLLTLTREFSRRLSLVGGVFIFFGMVGLAAAHGFELAAYGLTQAGNTEAAVSALEGNSLDLPGIVFLIVFLGGAVLGVLTLSVAAWRSPLVPRIAVVFMLGFAVLDFAVGTGVLSHLVNFVGSVILARAVMTEYSR